MCGIYIYILYIFIIYIYIYTQTEALLVGVVTPVEVSKKGQQF